MLALKIDTSELERELRLVPKQIPFALSRALNLCAAYCRDASKNAAQESLTVRNKYTLSGIVTENSRKDRLEAIVGALDTRWWMASQAYGDPARKDPDGVTHIASTEGEGAPRPSPDKVVPRSLRMDRIDDSKKAPYFVMRKGDRAIGIFYRDSPERPARRKTMGGMPVPGLVRPRLTIQPAYTFSEKVEIHPKWPFEATVSDTFGQFWPTAVEKAVIEALWSAR